MIESLSDRRSLLADDGVTAIVGAVTGGEGGFPYTFPIIFGENSVIDPETTITGLFDHAYIESHSTEGYHPVLLVVDEDVKLVTHDRRIALLGTVYEVKKKAPDGHGFTQLQLHEVGQYTSAIEPLAYPYTIADYFRTDAETHSITTEQ